MLSLDWPKTDRWIMGESWVGSRLSEYLVELTDGIGPRWAGTDGDARAARYIRGVMQSFGLAARLEEFELDTWAHGACRAMIEYTHGGWIPPQEPSASCRSQIQRAMRASARRRSAGRGRRL